MEDSDSSASTGDGEFDVEHVLEQLEMLESSVTSHEERQDVRRAKGMLNRLPGQDRIKKYTTKDIAEGFVGGIVFSLPLLVEDGVFEIAEWFTAPTVGTVPVFLVANVLFVVVLTTGLLYATDFREVTVTKPILGVVPRRLLGALLISFAVAAGLMFAWGRLHVEDPSQLERLARITVIWTAAALGASLGDILPGESTGQDISDLLPNIGDGAEVRE